MFFYFFIIYSLGLNITQSFTVNTNHYLLKNKENICVRTFQAKKTEKIFDIVNDDKKWSLRGSETKVFLPKTINQKILVDTLNNRNNTIVFVLGPAGTGKTLFSIIKSIQDFKNGLFDKIIITKPSVTVDEELGFLPGTANKKMDPYVRNIFDIFSFFYSKKDIDTFINTGVFEISPLGFMRGRTFSNSFIIADEAQNTTPAQLKMLLTRIGDNSRMVITGDLQQSDLSVTNGLLDFYDKCGNDIPSGISFVYLNDTDVQRSPIIKSILDIYARKPLSNNFNTIHPDNDCAIIPKSIITKNPLYKDVF
jgi:phosphate starvation-inducible PhoH-like protein